MIDNLCVIRGTVSDIYFDWVSKDKGDRIEFLRLLVCVKRNTHLQSSTPNFVNDTLRVVAYGEQARKAYAGLSPTQPVVVTGWLQCRHPRKSKAQSAVMEIVAWQIMPVGQFDLSIDPQLASQIQSLAVRYHVEPNELVNTLLAPQVKALEAGMPGDTHDEEIGHLWKSESLAEQLLNS